MSTLVEYSLEDRLQACRRLHAESLESPRRFWLREAGLLDWVRPPEEAFAGDMLRGDLSWFAGGLLSPAWNAVDRHASVSPERTALLWARAEGDLVAWSFRRLRQESSRMAQVLLAQGVRWGDRVVAYLPETPTLAMLHLGCARIGAVPVAVPVSAPALLGRVLRATRARVLVTADAAAGAGEPRAALGAGGGGSGRSGAGGVGAGRAAHRAPRSRLVYGRDHDLGVALLRARPTCAVRPCDAEDPLLLTTAPGDDGPPVLHAMAGFLVGSALGLREAAGIGPGAQVLCTEGFAGPRVDVLWGTWVLGGSLVFDERGDGASRSRALGLTHLLGPRAALAAAGPSVLGVALDGSDAAVSPVWSADGGGMLAARFGDLGGTPLFGIEPVLVDASGRRMERERRATPSSASAGRGPHSLGRRSRTTRASSPSGWSTFPGSTGPGSAAGVLEDGSLVWTGPVATAAPSGGNLFPLEGPIGRA